jgi:hypothetical protein
LVTDGLGSGNNPQKVRMMKTLNSSKLSIKMNIKLSTEVRLTLSLTKSV